jgi:hypothetical protein
MPARKDLVKIDSHWFDKEKDLRKSTLWGVGFSLAPAA